MRQAHQVEHGLLCAVLHLRVIVLGIAQVVPRAHMLALINQLWPKVNRATMPSRSEQYFLLTVHIPYGITLHIISRICALCFRYACVYLYVYLSIAQHPSISQPLCLSLYLLTYLAVSLSVYLSAYLSVCPPSSVPGMK
jgi:hypothetical protein